MDRLTHGIYTFEGKVEDVENDYLLEIQKRLAHYEDLIEQGKMIELPCKVGTKRYYIQNNVCKNWNDDMNYCKYFYKNSDGSCNNDGCHNCIDRDEEARIREHVFTMSTHETKYDIFKYENTYETREQAEKKLKEIQERRK